MRARIAKARARIMRARIAHRLRVNYARKAREGPRAKKKAPEAFS